MKSTIIKTILGMAALISLFLACAEAETFFSQILWSGSMLLICGVSAKGLERYMSNEEINEEV